jgi:hypothetical protein
MKGTRFYKIIIALLVVVNLSMLIFMWLGRPPHPPRPGDAPQLANEIGLTDENKSKVDELEKQHHIDKHSLMREDTRLHKEMFSLVGTNKDVDSVQKLLNTNKEEIERMTFDFFNNVADYCNNEQKKILREHIENRLMRMGPPPPPK